MKVRYREQLSLSRLDPLLTLVTLAFGTVAIATTIVTYLYMSTAIATIDMATQCDGSTIFNRSKCPYLPAIKCVLLHTMP